MITRIFAGLTVFIGLVFIANAVFPIVFYEIFNSRSSKDLVSPIPQNQNVLSFKTSLPTTDLTRASNWFTGELSNPLSISTKVQYYTLSIPKLGIKDATVEIAGEDLSKNLIQYKGTGLPGQIGNTVIFGHSVLPQFFNPKNYMTIFSTLPTLHEGDEIFVNYDGITYKYEVIEMFEVLPSEISVLGQRWDDSYLTLITCVPPGTYLRRLIVRAKIVPFQNL